MTREEAINEIRSWDFLNGKEIEAVQTLIPELRESEDERIRKWLIDYFSSIKETVWIHRDITCIQILAYLEKQKEPSWKPSEEQMDALKELIDDANKVGWVTPGATELYEQLKKL